MKNKFLVILFLVIAGVALLVYFTSKNSTLKKELRDFAVEDTATVNKIFMVDKNNHSVLLERKEDGWMANNKFKARKDGIDLLLKTICRLDVKAPVPNASRDNIIKQLAGKSTKVEIYQNDELVKVYYVGGATPDQQGTYMILENSASPFIMHVPGFFGYLSVRYFIDETLWRDQVIFSYSFENMESVSVTYFSEPDDSYLVSKDPLSNFSLKDGKGTSIADFDTMRVKEVFAVCKNLKYESLVDAIAQERKDSILHSQPYAVISVVNRKGEAVSLKTFQRKNIEGLTGYDGVPYEYDPDRMYGQIDKDTSLVTVQFFVLDPVLRKFKDFLKQPS